MFNIQMALIFLGVPIVFTVSSFNKSDCLDFIANDEWHQFTQSPSTRYQVLRSAGVFTQAATEEKPVPEFQNTLLVNLVCLTRESH